MSEPLPSLSLSETIVRFGEGRIGIFVARTHGAKFDNALAFAVHPSSHSVGEPVPDCVGKQTDEMGCFLRFEFTNTESVQVLIDSLSKIKASMLE